MGRQGPPRDKEMDVKARDVFAAVLGGSGVRRNLIALNAIAALVAFALPSAASAACSNEAIRHQQHAGHLPDCRAWEKVSPADKGNGDIVADGINVVAARDGDGVVFNSRTTFGDVVGVGAIGHTQYLARRDALGWGTHSITPTARADVSQTSAGPTVAFSFSDDLRTAILWAYDMPGVEDDASERKNIYVEDTATRALQTVTLSSQVEPRFFAEFIDTQVWGISADAKHVAFVANFSRLLPEAVGPFKPNMYQWDDGVLSLAGILPDGTVPAEGSEAAVPGPTVFYRGAMSADGSRQLFKASPTEGASRQLYQRVDGNRTIWISEPEWAGAPLEPLAVSLAAATPDGRHVFFVTDSPLLEEDINSGPDVYRWSDSAEPASEPNLTLITHEGDALQDRELGGSVIGSSDDGEIAYIHTNADRLEVWDHGAISLITDEVQRRPHPRYWLSALGSSPGLGRVTPDGRFLAFATDSTAGAGSIYGAPTGAVTNGHREVYLYSLEDEEIICVSCPVGAATADARIEPAIEGGVNVTEGAGIYTNDSLRPHFLADDGRVYFSTPEALLPEDTNGTLDAYQFDPAGGELSLLSSGKSKFPSAFLDASASGEDVFIATRQPLVAADTDELVDMYDVRSGGGFDEPEVAAPAPCSGEACQGVASAPPSARGISSAGATRGNLKPRRCAKGKHRVRRHGKVRCVRRQPRKHRMGGAK